MTMRMADGDTIEFSLLLFFCTHMLRLKNIQINNIISSSHHTHVPRTILLVTVNIMIRLNIYNVFFSGILWIEMNTMFIQFGHYFFCLFACVSDSIICLIEIDTLIDVHWSLSILMFQCSNDEDQSSTTSWYSSAEMQPFCVLE